MKDLYEALGLTPQATAEEIKRAYRKQALQFHPDKGTNNHERMTLINNAYAVLSDEEKRRQWDQVTDLFANDFPSTSTDHAYERLSESGEPYSQRFKAQHAIWVDTFATHPLQKGSSRIYFNAAKTKALMPERAMAFFKNVIPRNSDPFDPTDPLYIIQEITRAACTFEILPPSLIELFQDESFRLFYRQTLCTYWKDDDFNLDKSLLISFDGRAQTKTFLDDLKEKLSHTESALIDSNARYLIRSLSLLLQFENDIHEKNAIDRTAHEYRDAAYHILDWFPAFADRMPAAVMLKLLTQAALHFQLAAQAESLPSLHMADQKLALQLHLITFAIAHRATPDIECDTLIHGLKSIAGFQYLDTELSELIPALQQHTELLVDSFPFYPAPLLNITLLQQDNALLNLMRKHLHALVARTLGEPTETIALSADIPDAVVLYQAYAACIKHWYEKPYQAQTENDLRLQLMAVLLADHGWDFADVEENLIFAGTTLQRDAQQWIQPQSLLSVTDCDTRDVFCSIDGLEIDYKKGELRLLATPADRKTPDCFRTFTRSDVMEMIHKNTDGALFSLDPVDPNMDYHPFNAMRFMPERLHSTRLFNTLLSTDYLLKSFTVGQEVQGIYPFETRSLDSLTRDLPEYLKKILKDFYSAQKSESLHRFWIEADSVPMAYDTSRTEREGVPRIHLYDPNMVLKKHKMTRDADGHLIDDQEKEEGWFFYLLTEKEKNLFHWIENPVLEPAMIFNLEGGNEVLCSENGKQSRFQLQNQDAQLEDLRRHCKCDENGKVIKTRVSSEIMYHLTRAVAEQSGKPHFFSAEYIFAQEFTDHYEEFALYFPEFKRLQELSRIVALIHVLNSVQKSTQESLVQLQLALRTIIHWENQTPEKHDRENPIQKAYDEWHTQIRTPILKNLSEWRKDLVYDTLFSKKIQDLIAFRKRIGTLILQPHGDEVNQACERLLDETAREHPSYSRADIRTQINAQRADIASELSKLKRKAVQEKLDDMLESSGHSHPSITQFLDNNDNSPLAHELTRLELSAAKKKISEILSNAPLVEVEAALQGSDAAVDAIVKHVSNKQFSAYLSKQKETLEEQCLIRKRLQSEIKTLGLGIDQKDTKTSGTCPWVPANINHHYSLAHHHARFVYGGVSIQPRIIQTHRIINNPNSVALSVQQLAGGNRGGAGGGSLGGGGAAASGSASRGGSGGAPSGGASGGSGSGPTHGRFTMLVNNGTKADVMNILSQGNGLTVAQAEKMKDNLKGIGQTSAVTVKLVNHSGEARMSWTRPGYDGYQRMSRSTSPGGHTRLVVQTAFNAQHKIERQQPGEPKNNIYDVKYPKSWGRSSRDS